MTEYFYYRCSTASQDEERQIRSALDAGVKKENIYGDKITGISQYGDRPAYTEMVNQLKTSDVVITEDLTRYGRSLVLMLVEINKLIEKGVEIKTLDKRLDTTSMPKEIVRLLVSVMGYASECELMNLKRRTAEGREVARSRGVKFGRKKSYTDYQLSEIKSMRSSERGYGAISKALGMSKTTVQRICKEVGI